MQTGDQYRILSADLAVADPKKARWPIIRSACKVLKGTGSSRQREERCYLCRHGFTALCKGLHQTPAWMEGGRMGGREGTECTGVGGKWSEAKTASIAIRSSNKVLL